MRHINEIFNTMQDIAPLTLCESWDNSGLLVRMAENIENVLLVLDVTDATIDEAIKKHCQLIISHHPVIFKGMKSITRDDLVAKLIRNNISVISMHTNLDAAEKGVNAVLSQRLGLFNVQPFADIGRIGEIDSLSLCDFADKIARTLNGPVKFTSGQKIIKKVAVIGGSAGGYWKEAKAQGCDAFITGEASHHDACDALHAGMGLIVAGHFNTEVLVMPEVQRIMEKEFADVNFILSSADADPFNYIANKAMECQRCGIANNDIVSTFSANGEDHSFCPNCMMLSYASGYLEKTLKEDPRIIDDITHEPGAIMFTCKDEMYKLNKKAMLRLVAKNLTPEEYQILSEKYGNHGYMIHDDFYDPEGNAIQPIE